MQRWMENTAMTLLVPSPVAMETIPSIYAPGFLVVLSESESRGWKEEGKTTQGWLQTI